MGYWINRVDGLEPPFDVVHEQVVSIPAQDYLPVSNTARKLLLVLSGECRHQIVGYQGVAVNGPHGDVHLRPGDILSIPVRCEQRYLSLKAGATGSIHVVRVAFDANLFPPLPMSKSVSAMGDADARPTVDGLIARCLNRVLYLPGGVTPDGPLARTLHALREEARLQQPEHRLRIYGLCVSLVALFARQVQETENVSRGRAPLNEVPAAEFHVSKIKPFLRQHLASPRSLSQIAEHVCLSEEHVARMFKKATGVTLSAYGRRLRITEAQSLLASTDLNLGEIAARCGFASLTVFSRNFKRETGLTPSEFRQQIARQMG